MTEPSLLVRELRRFPSRNGRADHLVLEPGVNVLVGPPNTGKSQWLRTLDLLLGSDKKADELLAEGVFESYDSAEALVTIGGEDYQLSRRWKEDGVKTKVFVNGEPKDLRDFSHFVYDHLGIPLVHYPQGNPYGPRTWPELSWRSLLRHMYRRQRFWSDIADKQPDSEQHACVLHFLGLAEHLFSPQYGKQVETEKEIQALKMRRKDFLRMLEEVSKDLVDEEDLDVALTRASLDDLVDRLSGDIKDLEQSREEMLLSLRREASEHAKVDDDLVDGLAEQLAAERARQEEVASALQDVSRRLRDLQKYRDLLYDESERMGRAAEAAVALSAIQISHCPACDRELEGSLDADAVICFLCHRPWDVETGDEKRAQKRVEFERQQLSAELKEADALVTSLSTEKDQLRSDAGRVSERISSIELRLNSVRSAAAAIMPPEVGLTNIEVGRLQQRLLQIRRVRSSLSKREDLAKEIARLDKRLADLVTQVRQQRAGLDFISAAEALTDGMNSYLNSIHAIRESLWAQKPVSMLLDDSGYRFQIGDRSWQSKLGGTATLFFLIAYHYGLMSLTGQSGRHFPGFLVLDFPAELDDGTSVGDKENFVLEPFVDLMAKPASSSRQLIAAGSAFEGLEGVHRIELDHIWS